MTIDRALMTPTMARVYADQGHYKKAAQIYRQLLKTDPESKDYLEALADMEQKMLGIDQPSDHILSELFALWIELELGAGNLRRLKRLQAKR